MVCDDTIVALATPPGRGAIAIIRVSGKDAHDIARQHVTPWPSELRQVTLCTLHGGNTTIDRALVTVFAQPRSFTGEDLVEIATHGGTLVPVLVLAALIGSGAREALPGEFTKRAVLNGKLDLAQAEAIGDLIDAGSRAMHAVALRQLDGGLSQRIQVLRGIIIELEALIAYDIDFPEEDDGPISHDRVAATVYTAIETLENLLATAPIGELLRTGATVVIAGAPNAGKSSLFNALLGIERAIVTDVPGTTRDAIEAVIDVGPWPIRLVDTAGLRETQNAVERMGVEVSMRHLAAADVVLSCGETDTTLEETTRVLKEATTAPILQVRTKGDIGMSNMCLQTSAATGQGLRSVLDAINQEITARHGQLSFDAPILTRERHQHAITLARDEIVAFKQAWVEKRLPAPVAAAHLRAAVHALEDVVGGVDMEEVFDRLFGTFCIGK